MLKVVFELSITDICKSLIVFPVFLKKVFKLSLRHLFFGLAVIFIPISLLNNYFVEK